MAETREFAQLKKLVTGKFKEKSSPIKDYIQRIKITLLIFKKPKNKIKIIFDTSLYTTPVQDVEVVEEFNDWQKHLSKTRIKPS